MTGYVEELIKDEDFAFIKEVEYNIDFSKFTLTVDKEGYENSFNGFAVMSIAMPGRSIRYMMARMKRNWT